MPVAALLICLFICLPLNGHFCLLCVFLPVTVKHTHPNKRERNGQPYLRFLSSHICHVILCLPVPEPLLVFIFNLFIFWTLDKTMWGSSRCWHCFTVMVLAVPHSFWSLRCSHSLLHIWICQVSWTTYCQFTCISVSHPHIIVHLLNPNSSLHSLGVWVLKCLMFLHIHITWHLFTLSRCSRCPLMQIKLVQCKVL